MNGAIGDGVMGLLCSLTAFTLAFTGWASLALSQARHWRAVAGTRPRWRGRQRRVIGAGLLALALAPCLLRDDASFAALTWLLLLSVAAMVLALVLAYRPRLLRLLA